MHTSARHLLCHLVALSFAIPTVGWSQNELLSEDFEGASVDTKLTEQGFWQKSHMTSGNVTVEKEESNQYAASSYGENEFCQIDSAVLNLTPGSVVVLSFDVYLESEQSSVGLGIGPGGLVPSIVGVVQGTFAAQASRDWATVSHARSPSGVAVRAGAGQWISIQSRWDLADNDGIGSATLEIKNTGEESFTPLFFDVQQSQEKASLNINQEHPVTAWRRVFFRLKDARIDNLRIAIE